MAAMARRGARLALAVALVPALAAVAGPSRALPSAAAGPAAEAPPNPWAEARKPSAGPGRAVGGYSSGCLIGGARLPARGKGFKVAEPDRRRFFGHPALVEFIRSFGAAVHAGGLGVLPIGDLSQPRGGPAPNGHASHQTGLDADIWYVDGRGRGRTRKVAMVDIEHHQPSAAFSDRIGRVLALAAGDPRVDRIFVNPVIKRQLCTGAGAERGWLRKLRPWWLHHEHFHVRLACPADSPDCKPQGIIPDGDGCSEVDWWLQPKAESERVEKRKQYRSKLGSVPVLPEPCAALLAGDEAEAAASGK
jgi:penicillin-insensitive murein endopeptidase